MFGCLKCKGRSPVQRHETFVLEPTATAGRWGALIIGTPKLLRQGRRRLGTSVAGIKGELGLTDIGSERTGSSGGPSATGTCGSCVVHMIESDLIRLRTREGMKVAKAKGAYAATTQAQSAA